MSSRTPGRRFAPAACVRAATSHTQRGISFVGFAFVAAVLVLVLMLGFRIAPAVIEYYSVQQALSEALQNVKDPTAVTDVKLAFQRRIDAGYIQSVTARDVEFTRDGNTVIATIAWSRTLHLVANASLVLDFEAKASR